MGLKKYNYTVENFGLELPSAYARITNLSIDLEGNANAIIKVQQDRDLITTADAFETVIFRTNIDKDAPVHQQVYNAVKAEGQPFEGWEDDIVEE